MSRQVDIKALVSHVVRGDGINKCRICMGDTSEGQVFLGDTVLMDGDQPVTLSELLETITGVQMAIDEDLPVNLCSLCSMSALNAAHFRTACRRAAHKWETIVQLLANIPQHAKDRSLFALVEEDQMVLLTDCDSISSSKTAAYKLTRKMRNIQNSENVKTCQKQRYECPDCGKQFGYVHQLYRHLKESTDLKRACYICAKIMNRDELVRHLKEQHNQKPYDCKKCPALLPSYNKYVQHLRQAHSQGSCTCGDCGRSFKTANSFRAHLSVHTKKSCPSCDKVFRNQTCYLYHVKKCCNLERIKSHKGMLEVKNKWSEKKVKVGLRGRVDTECICDYCNKKFAGKKFISAHIQIVHMKNTHSPCVYCGKFLAAAHMSEHVKKHQDLSFKCDLCGIVLRTKLGYIQHLRLHSGEKPYPCRYCKESFSASSRRSEHIRKVHKSSDIVLKYECSKCSAKFRLPYMLKKHMLGHSERQVQFECYVCHEKFSTSSTMLKHCMLHKNT
ncbi:PREDICTED: zinc finger protein 471-like isoform X2 [Papilio polytes]|uniref:zinc finger protein 471-like isoform X2 n=1 Tax=Papilio polytes TaxID=76194 RepID=UPI00067682BA|nr:PREDICTED: zinc finger protein 471-like isoform X2 [Papilio polytes]